MVDFLIMILMERLLRLALFGVDVNADEFGYLFEGVNIFVGDGGGKIMSHKPSLDVLLNPVNIVVLFFVTCMVDLVNRTSHPSSHN